MHSHLARVREQLVDRYLDAKALVIESGFAPEIDWQDELRLEDVTEPTLLRELAWVILSSGMRESVIRRCFPKIANAFLEWTSAVAIMQNRRSCLRRGISVYAHERKIRAIADAAELIGREGFESTKARLLSQGMAALQGFAFIGSVTIFHIAKNLGMDVVKPDRHLCRLSAAAGYVSPHTLCTDICLVVGDRLSVVDLVLWRFATLRGDYCSFFEINDRGQHGDAKRIPSRKSAAHRRERKPRVLCFQSPSGTRIRYRNRA